MEIRYCCKFLYDSILQDEDDRCFGEEAKIFRTLLRNGELKYCPFCGAKIVETKLYEKEENI